MGVNASLAAFTPTVVSATATNITQTSARLNGVVNPNGFTTSAMFQTPTENIQNSETTFGIKAIQKKIEEEFNIYTIFCDIPTGL